jgi:hypothetical protein
MSAQEVIEMIKALPPQEQREVAEFARTLKEESEPNSDIRPGFDQAAREMFDQYKELFRELAK